MGLLTLGIRTRESGDARALRKYLFISSPVQTKVQKEQNLDMFENVNLLNNNTQTSNRFMSSMNTFIA